MEKKYAETLYNIAECRLDEKKLKTVKEMLNERASSGYMCAYISAEEMGAPEARQLRKEDFLVRAIDNGWDIAEYRISWDHIGEKI